jgi:APA family basic amino acid/polyamine antiporter
VRRRALQTQQLSAQPERQGQGLRKCLGATDLVLLGVGAIVGAGVFVLTGVAAHDHAG